MPHPPKVQKLPEGLRSELDSRIVRQGFGGYVALSEWLAERGYEIGKSALAVHGSKLERRIRMLQVATTEAEALVSASPDDSGAVAEATLRIAQERIFQTLMAADDGDLKTLAAVGKAAAEATRAGIALRDARKRAKAEMAQALEAEAKRQERLPAASPAEMAEAFRKALTEV